MYKMILTMDSARRILKRATGSTLKDLKKYKSRVRKMAEDVLKEEGEEKYKDIIERYRYDY